MNDALEPDADMATPMEIAADWLDEFDTLTPERRQALQAWLRASDENARAFALMRKMMLDVALVEAAHNVQARDAVGAPAPRRARGRQVHCRPGLAPARTAFGRLQAFAGLGLATAAAVVVAVSVWPTLHPLVTPSPGKGQAYVTAIGARSDVALSDQSIAHLNADTRLTVLFSNRVRDIRLDQGEAMFEVTHNPARPFNVAVGAVTVTAVGTVFDVERVGDATEVRVFKGAVNVAQPGAPKFLLRAGDWWTLDPSRGPSTGRFEPASYQTWRNDWLQAENMPLKYAIARLNRYSPQKIDLTDAAEADVQITGRFDLRKTDATLTMISALLKLRTVRDGAGLHLEPVASPVGR